MEKYIIGVTVAFFFVLFAILIGSMFYGISKIEPGTTAGGALNTEANSQEKSSPDDSAGSAGSGGGGELGTISPLSGNGSGGSGGGGGGGGGAGESSVNPPKIELPPDLYTAPCGIYFTSYGVCNGSCEEGICSQEGRSCYCKLV